MEFAKRSAFRNLKPLCLAVLNFHPWAEKRDPCAALLDLLDAERSTRAIEYGDDALASLADYVAFPILQLLRHGTTSDSNAEAALACLQSLLLAVAASGSSLNRDVFAEILTVCAVFVAVGGFRRLQPQTARGTISPSLQVTAIQCLSSLIGTLKDQQLDSLSDDALWKPFTHGIFGLLETIESEDRELETRIAALDALLSIVRKLTLLPPLMLRIVPGIMSTATKICLRDAKENHRTVVLAASVTATCVRTTLDEFARLSKPELAMSGGSWESQVSDWTDIAKQGSHSRNKRKLEQSEASQASDKETLHRFERLIPTLLGRLRSHPHEQVRDAAITLAVAVSASGLLTSPVLVADALETIHILSESDDDVSLRGRASAELDLFRSSVHGQQWGVVEITLRSRFSKTLEQLPETLRRTAFGERKFDGVHFVNSSLALHGQDLVASLPPRLYDWWLQDIEDAISEILANRPKRVVRGSSPSILPALLGGDLVDSFKAPSSAPLSPGDSGKLLSSLARLLFYLSAVDPEFRERSLDRFSNDLSSLSISLGAIFIFEDGLAPVLAKENQSLLRDLLHQSVDGFLAERQTADDRRLRLVSHQSDRLHDAHAIVQRLRFVSICAKHLDVDNFDGILPDVLFYCLSHIGINQFDVSQAAKTAIDALASRFGVEPVDLVVDNIDTVIDMFCARLRRLFLSPEVPHALRAAIVVGGARIAPLIEDTVEEIFDALDVWKRNDAIVDDLLLIVGDVGEALAQAVLAKEPTEKDEPTTGTETLESILGKGISLEIRAFYLKFGQLPRSDTSDPDSETYPPSGDHRVDSADDDDSPRKNPTIPLLIQILDKCCNFLSHPSPTTRRKLLRIFGTTLPGLKANPEDLLPLVHRIWPTIVSRLNDSDRFVALEALRLVARVAEVATDFMTKRISEDVLPELAQIWRMTLSEMNNTNADLHRNSTSRATFNVKLLHRLLSSTAAIVERVPLQLKELHALEREIAPLLNVVAMSSEFEADGLNLLRALGQRDWEGMWLLLQAWLGREDIPPWYLGGAAVCKPSARVPQARKRWIEAEILARV